MKEPTEEELDAIENEIDTRDNPLWLAIVDARTSYIEESMDEPEDLYLEIIQAATILVAWAEAVKRKELNDVE